MADVVLYTKTYCPYSQACKKFLEEKGVSFTERIIDLDPALEAEVTAKFDGRTDTPHVLINGHLIGSFDDLKALDAQGQLDEMLNLS